MKNFFLLILMLTAIYSCKNKGNGNSEMKTKKTEPFIEKQIKRVEVVKNRQRQSKNIKDWTHPYFFEFKNYKEYRVTDTISIDLNGNGILESIYFDKKDCPKLIIEEKGRNLISLGCGKEEYKGLPNAVGWVNLWCVVLDKETVEVIVEDGELIGDRTVQLERPSIYIGKEESGGGIITYRNGKLYWIHQSD